LIRKSEKMKSNLPSVLGKSRLRFDITLSLDLPRKDIMEDLLRDLNNKNNDSEDIDSLFVPDQKFKTARELVRDADLPDFDSLKWVAFSQTDFLLENRRTDRDDKKELFRASGLKDLLATGLVIYAPRAGSFLKMFFIGDYRPVIEMADIIVTSKLQNKDYDLDWNAFSPDPYLDYSSGINNIGTPISKVNQFYDDFVGQKFYSGQDGTGKLTRENLLWMVSNPQIRAEVSFTDQKDNKRDINPNFCIGLLDRLNYMSYGVLRKDVIKCYSLLVGMIASTQIGGVGILEIPTPNCPAMDGIVGLFSTFFSRLHVIKLKQDTMDNDTVYLLGSSFNKNPNESGSQPIYPIDKLKSYVEFLSQEDKFYPVLSFMSKRVKSFHDELNIVMTNPLKTQVNRLLDTWPSRNI
jgi:hypothetical protein